MKNYWLMYLPEVGLVLTTYLKGNWKGNWSLGLLQLLLGCTLLQAFDFVPGMLHPATVSNPHFGFQRIP